MSIRSEQISVENGKLIIGTTVNSVPNVGVAMSHSANSQLTFEVDTTDPEAIKLYIKDHAIHGSSTTVDGQTSQIEAASISSNDIANGGIATINIADDAVDSTKILGADGGSVATSYDFSGITSFSVPEPTAGSHAATKRYVDDFAQGLLFKDAALVASSANIDSTYDSEALTLTLLSNQQLVIDGKSLVDGDRVLLFGQTDATQNGIYVVTHAGSISSVPVLTRADDFNETDEIRAGSYVLVTDGTALALNAYVVQSNAGLNPILDTTNINWALFSGSATAVQGGNGISVSGTTVAVDIASIGDTLQGLEFLTGSLAVNVDDATIALDAGGAVSVKIGGAGSPSLQYNNTVGSEGLVVRFDTSMAVGEDGIRAAILADSENNTLQQAVITNTGSTGIALTRVPVLGADVYIYVNGVMQTVGDGTVVGVDFFFMPSGSTNIADVRSFDELIVGDVLWFNPAVAGFNFATTDKVRIVFSSL